MKKKSLIFIPTGLYLKSKVLAFPRQTLINQGDDKSLVVVKLRQSKNLFSIKLFVHFVLKRTKIEKY